VAKHPRREDPVAQLQEEARWSSFTNSWSRPARGGPRWVRRFLIGVILLVFVTSVIGAVVSIVEGDPIERAFGEAYSLTSQELAAVRSDWDADRTEEEWAEFVDEAEEAISRKHTLWRASRGVEARWEAKP
jgi:hypothetical protein